MTGNRNTQEKEMTQDELRHFIANNMPEGMIAVIHFDNSEDERIEKNGENNTGRS